MTTLSLHDATPILRLRNLQVQFTGSPINVLDHISLTVKSGETLALVGESGSGKSVTSLALMGLLPNNAQIIGGEMLFRSHNLRQLSSRELADLRGNELAMIFQEPMTSLNPILTIGDQLSEAVMRHQSMSHEMALITVLQALKKVQIPVAEMRLKSYPHQLSGGMRQRVMIAMALINKPRFLIADEPTTALDATIQAQILALLNTLQADTGTAILMITHDLGVVAEVSQQMAVMYAGQIVEQGCVKSIFADPQHPYTIGLMGAIPSLGTRKGPLSSIPGSLPLPEMMPKGCRFSTRCPFVQARCIVEKPPLQLQGVDHRVACFRVPLEQHIELG